MFPKTFTGVSPDWLALIMFETFRSAAPPTVGGQRALRAMIVHAANASMIKAAQPIATTFRVDKALKDLNDSWRDIALLGVLPSEHRSALALLSKTSPSTVLKAARISGVGGFSV